MVTAAILVPRPRRCGNCGRPARSWRARAVEQERLRFSRDLHDLLGHTLSVIVVKSEAARRLAPRDLDAALAQVTDIESVGRQALTEIREAVTGYREGSLATELDRARSALSAAGIEPVVRRSGPPLAPQTEALLGWVVREAVTNVVRHSGATRCEITVDGTPDRVRLTVADNGTRRDGSSPVPARRASAAPASRGSPNASPRRAAPWRRARLRGRLPVRRRTPGGRGAAGTAPRGSHGPRSPGPLTTSSHTPMPRSALPLRRERDAPGPPARRSPSASCSPRTRA